MEKIINKLYGVNADISLFFVTGLRKPTKLDMVHINKRLGEIIKELREYHDKNKK